MGVGSMRQKIQLQSKTVFCVGLKSKELLEKNFKPDLDYKCLLNLPVKQTNAGRGGHNKEKIMLNIKTFKLLCLKAGTKKAGQIHEYYLKSNFF